MFKSLLIFFWEAWEAWQAKEERCAKYREKRAKEAAEWEADERHEKWFSYAEEKSGVDCKQCGNEVRLLTGYKYLRYGEGDDAWHHIENPRNDKIRIGPMEAEKGDTLYGCHECLVFFRKPGEESEKKPEDKAPRRFRAAVDADRDARKFVSKKASKRVSVELDPEPEPEPEPDKDRRWAQVR